MYKRARCYFLGSTTSFAWRKNSDSNYKLSEYPISWVTKFEETTSRLSSGESFANVVQGLDQITPHSAANAAIVQQNKLFCHVLMLPGATKHQNSWT